MKKIGYEKVHQILDLHRQGNRPEKIATELNIAYSTVCRIIQCYKSCKSLDWDKISDGLIRRYYHHYIFEYINLVYIPNE